MKKILVASVWGIVFGTACLAAAPAPSLAVDERPAAEHPEIDRAAWIWGPPEADVCQFRLEVILASPPRSAAMLITADNGYELYVNSGPVGYDVGAGSEIWNSLELYDLTARLAQGRNVIGVRGIDLGGIRGLIAAVRVELHDGTVQQWFTGAEWRASVEGTPEEYSHPEFRPSAAWGEPAVLGPMGMTPWNRLTYAGSTGGRGLEAALASAEVREPDAAFAWPTSVAFLAGDCSVYVPLRGDAWGVCFRVENWTRAYTEFDLPMPTKIGRRLCVLDDPQRGGTPRVLVDAGRGAIGSPSSSFDGQSILVSMAREGDSFYHIYRVPLAGGPPQQLSDGPFHDLDPAELPDGRIVFSSTRIGTFEEYHNPPARALFVMDAAGRGIEPITFTPIFDQEPKVMADGRIAVVRTDNFFDRGKVETQIHVLHPDGTSGITEFGADVGADYGVRLRILGYGSPAPLPDGRLAFISTQGNFIGRPGEARAAWQQLPSGLGDLAPLPDGRLLATVLRAIPSGAVSDALAVFDPRTDQLVRIYRADDGSIHSPICVAPRPRPVSIPDRVAATRGTAAATGILHCQDVRFTRKTKADWPQIRAIRVLAARDLTTRSSHSHLVHAGNETVELGTVPIAPDGSFSVEVPADTPLALQAIDAEGRSELNEMSWISVRPGETRSCLGCHHDRHVAPQKGRQVAQAFLAPPPRLLGQGDPHRFRGNNAGVSGMMDLQFERFRENASLNRFREDAGDAPGRDEVIALSEGLGQADEGTRISAAQRLGLIRDAGAAAALAAALADSSREVRLAAGLALAACGTRDSLPPLLAALDDADPFVAQSAALALENLTGHREPFDPFVAAEDRTAQAAAWRAWHASLRWPEWDRERIWQLDSADRVATRRAIVALSHTGGDAARSALRDYVRRAAAENPYPPFVNDNRTDNFTFDAASPLNPRTLQAAVRGLGRVADSEAVPLLEEILHSHIDPQTGNLFLAEAALEALGRIGTPQAERVLVEAFGRLRETIQYVGWFSDHPALYPCHSSPLHARALESLDWIGATEIGAIIPALIRSIPTDPDRALFLANDGYEILAGRLIRRSGRSGELIETALTLLGDDSAVSTEELQAALESTFPAWAGHPGGEIRAAQILSAVCRDPAYEPRIRAAYVRYRQLPEEPVARPLGNPTWIPRQHWVLFYLGRTLGNLRSSESLATLVESLHPRWNEARHGRPDPSEPNVHFLQLEYTPCWRAAAAWALGRVGDRRAARPLVEVVQDLNNAVDTRHAAAEALRQLTIDDPTLQSTLRELAETYPEISTRKALR